MAAEKKNLLSPREKTIVQLVGQARSRKSIATELKLSIHTVDTHLRHIHLKTSTHSLPELILWQIKNQ